MYNHIKAQQSKSPCAYFLGYTVLFAKFPTQEHKNICLVPVPDDGVDDDDDGDDDDDDEEE